MLLAKNRTLLHGKLLASGNSPPEYEHTDRALAQIGLWEAFRGVLRVCGLLVEGCYFTGNAIHCYALLNLYIAVAVLLLPPFYSTRDGLNHVMPPCAAPGAVHILCSLLYTELLQVLPVGAVHCCDFSVHLVV